jgi:LacI family transcriptional regulator
MVTIQDIADRVGVSKTAVSLVLNNRGETLRISRRTCNKIKEVAAELGYCRNGIAYAMAKGKTNVIGLVGGFHGSWGLDIINGITKFINKSGYSIRLFHIDKDVEISSIIHSCIEERFSGVICTALCESDLDFMHKELGKANIPMALVDNAFSHNKCSHVLSDDFEGAKLVADFLCDLGHQKIVYISTPLTSSGTQLRHSGFLEGLKKHGIKLPEKSIGIVDKHYEITDSFVGTVKRVISENKATAVFCCSDPVAVKVLKVATNAGIKIPEELSVVGYADLNYTLWSIPALTTVRQPFEEMGRKIAEVLISEIKEQQTIGTIKLPVELIIRQSTSRRP